MLENNEVLKVVLDALDNKKAYLYKVIDISELTSMTDYFVICSVNNERQCEAAAEEVIEKMREYGLRLHHKEGYETGRWILLDFGFIIVHIFHKEERDVYSLEQLWSDGKNIDVEGYEIENWS